MGYTLEMENYSLFILFVLYESLWLYVWYGMVWFGLVWFGIVWFRMVWFGILWYEIF